MHSIPLAALPAQAESSGARLDPRDDEDDLKARQGLEGCSRLVEWTAEGLLQACRSELLTLSELEVDSWRKTEVGSTLKDPQRAGTFCPSSRGVRRSSSLLVDCSRLQSDPRSSAALFISKDGLRCSFGDPSLTPRSRELCRRVGRGPERSTRRIDISQTSPGFPAPWDHLRNAYLGDDCSLAQRTATIACGVSFAHQQTPRVIIRISGVRQSIPGRSSALRGGEREAQLGAEGGS